MSVWAFAPALRISLINCVSAGLPRSNGRQNLPEFPVFGVAVMTHIAVRAELEGPLWDAEVLALDAVHDGVKCGYGLGELALVFVPSDVGIPGLDARVVQVRLGDLETVPLLDD